MASSIVNTAIYPGSFDPITNGHMDVILRASRLFGRVLVTVARNPNKKPLFTVEERLALISTAVADLDGVEVGQFSGLVVEHARKVNATAIIRGLRAISDFEAEFQMALMNRHMEPEISAVFLMPHDRYTHLNSSIIREIAALGGDVSDFVPANVLAALKQKFQND